MKSPSFIPNSSTTQLSMIDLDEDPNLSVDAMEIDPANDQKVLTFNNNTEYSFLYEPHTIVALFILLGIIIYFAFFSKSTVAADNYIFAIQMAAGTFLFVGLLVFPRFAF